jgi:hypothetical protein
MAIQITKSETVATWAEVDGIKVSLGEREVSVRLYVKVSFVRATKANGTAHLLISNEDFTQTQTKEFPINLDGPNFIKQAYEHIKTLPEFAGSVDV